MSISEPNITADPGLHELETELLRLSPEIREHLGRLLLDSVHEPDEAELEADRALIQTARERWAAHQRGELAFISKEDAMADLRARLRR